ncbi:hypothetical protein LJC17_03050 [Acholeplasma sp. OttesenSCG-928-E16]|nr:hypothetical protein [Acholeplasma sp. OttesenSCG-928-E16]
MDITVTIILSIISVLGTLSSITFAYLAFKRNNKTDDKNEGKAHGVLISDVGYIKSSIDRMERSLEKVEERSIELSNRLVEVEQSVKSAHKRIDDLAKRKISNNSKGGN